MKGRIHELGSESVHYRWKAKIEPILTIEPGDTVKMMCRDGFDGQVDPPVVPDNLDADLYSTIDFRRVAPVTGPISIRGSEPGDTLEVRVQDLTPFGTGTLVIFPSWFAADILFADHRPNFPKGWIRRFDMDKAARDGSVEFHPNVRIPMRPMLGMMATAPAEGDFPTGPPRNFGGNMDVKDIAAGSIVYLPVYQSGALFSAGDGHAVQGDGEVCATGIETPLQATLEFHLHKGRTIPGPQVETESEFMTIAFAPTLEEASKRAINYMVDYLAQRRGFTCYEAYGLLSLAGDLRINQIVNYPHFGVRMAVRKSLFSSWVW
jgi:acetamidase/formamidase